MIDVSDLLGVPYVDHGRTISGFDCYGLAIEAARRFGYKLNDVVYENHDIELSDRYAPTLNVTPVEKPFPGAVIEMQYGNDLHIGVCLSDRDFIHMTRTGCRVNRIGTLPIRGFYAINSRI